MAPKNDVHGYNTCRLRLAKKQFGHEYHKAGFQRLAHAGMKGREPTNGEETIEMHEDAHSSYKPHPRDGDQVATLRNNWIHY